MKRKDHFEKDARCWWWIKMECESISERKPMISTMPTDSRRDNVKLNTEISIAELSRRLRFYDEDFWTRRRRHATRCVPSEIVRDENRDVIVENGMKKARRDWCEGILREARIILDVGRLTTNRKSVKVFGPVGKGVMLWAVLLRSISTKFPRFL